MMPDYGEIKSSEGILVIEYIFYAKKKKYTNKMGKANILCGCRC